MTDRELLELAAKAAGLGYSANNFASPEDDLGGWGMVKDIGDFWNPLADDGDALRLASKLKIDIEWQATQMLAEPEVEAYISNIDGACFCASEHDSDYRRAIVRAAANLGEQMP